ncbi:MAG: extracellular solute-binding protein [Myxococcota bacterium]
MWLALLLCLGLLFWVMPEAFGIFLPSLPRPYEGQTLRVLSFQDNHSRAVSELLVEFEALSGATVVFDRVASAMVMTKTGIDQAAGGTYDLYTIDEPFLPYLSGLLVPIREWPAPQLRGLRVSAPGAFLPAAVEAGSFRGEWYGLPVSGNVYLYVYRTDLFDSPKEQRAFLARYGYPLAVPTSLQAMRDVAEFFTRPPSLYGFAPFTKASEGTTVEALWVLSSFGTQPLSDGSPHGRLTVTLDEQLTVKAFRYYMELLEYAPPGGRNWHHAERMAAYRKGKVAQLMTWPNFFRDLENPSRSRVVGRNGYALPPAEAGGRPSPVAGSWTLAMPRSTQHRALAAEFAYWWASAEVGHKLVEKGMNPARRDLLSDPELRLKWPWFPAVMQNFEQAIMRPRLSSYKAVNDCISLYFTKMIAGQQTPEEAARQLRVALERVVVRSQEKVVP